jgi:hypothetical protein
MHCPLPGWPVYRRLSLFEEDLIELKEAENLYSIVWTLEKLALQQALPHVDDAVIQE